MRLGIDLDGVVVDFVQSASEHLGFYMPDDVRRWDDVFNLAGLTPKRFFEECRREHVFAKALPVEGALDGIRTLLASDEDVQFVTHRPDWATDETYVWLDHYLPDVADLESRIHIVGSGLVKSSVYCNVYLDDAPHVLEELMRKHRYAVRFERPWNRNVIAYRKSVADWPQFVELVESLRHG